MFLLPLRESLAQNLEAPVQSGYFHVLSDTVNYGFRLVPWTYKHIINQIFIEETIVDKSA